MELKKTEEASLERKKVSLFLLGLLTSTILIFLALNVNSANIGERDLPAEKAGMEDEIIEMVVLENIVPPPPPPPPEPEPEVIEVVDNKKEIKEEEIVKVTNVDEDIVLFEEPEAPKVEEIFTVVEKQPSFPGGEAKLFEYLGKNIKYTEMAKEASIRGKVYIQFVVEKDGSITDVKIIRGLGSGLDEIAKKAVRKMPKWEPGEQRGKPVRVRFVLPVNFTLR